MDCWICWSFAFLGGLIGGTIIGVAISESYYRKKYNENSVEEK